MSEFVSADRVAFAGAVGPDLLRIPAEPSRLKQAAQQLTELADHLDQAGQHLAGTDGRHEDRAGHTTSALMQVAKWNGKNLSRDAVMLRELGEATEHEAQLLTDLQAHDLPQLRRRWMQARDQFLAELRQAAEQPQPAAEPLAAHHAGAGGGGGGGQGGGGQGGGGQGGGGGQHRRVQADQGGDVGFAQAEPVRRVPPPDAHALMDHIDENAVQPYEELFRQLNGRQVSFGGGGGGSAMLSDERTESAVAAYRQSVRSVLEEFDHLVQRVTQVDRQVEERIHRPEKDRAEDEQGAVLMSAAGGGDMVSGVVVLRHLVEDLRAGAKAEDEGHDRITVIATALKDGRLPVREDQDRDGFRAEWQQHFQRRTERLRTVCAKVEDVLEKFSRLDAECAEAIRAH